MAEKRIMRTFKLLEVSGVDRPAQVGARVTLMKRAWEPTEEEAAAEVEKGCCYLTSDEMGHSHLVDITKEAGETSWSKAEGEEVGHSHPYIVSADGKVKIGAADGHTHKVLLKAYKAPKPGDQDEETDAEGNPLPKGKKSKKSADGPPASQQVVNPTDNPMTDTQKAGGNVTAEQLDKLTKDLARATALAGLNDAQKAHLNSLDAAGQESFLGKSAADRAADMAKSAGDNPVVYTDRDGNSFRKSDDQRLVAAAKRADLAWARSEAMEKRAKTAELEKRAGDELGRYPGSTAAKVALLEKLDELPEAVRAEVSQLVKAGNEAIGMFGQTRGSQAPVPSFGKDIDPMAEIDRLAGEVQKSNPGMTIEKARVKVLETPVGDALYAKVIGVA